MSTRTFHLGPSLALFKVHHRDDTIPNVPDVLHDLASEIFNLQCELDERCREYDLKWLTAKQQLFELSTQESKRLKALERDVKHKKEREKLGQKLRGFQKKQFKKTGKLPEEILAEMIAVFKQANGMD